MKYMRWSWLDWQSCPASYRAVIVEEFAREVKAQQEAARKARQRGRRR